MNWHLLLSIVFLMLVAAVLTAIVGVMFIQESKK
jgi:hypothetical protein